MNKQQNKIGFLKACYQADNREQFVFNYFDNKVEHKYLIESKEFLQGELAYLPIKNDYAQDVMADLKVYQYEKSLFVSALFLCGRSKNYNKRLNAPLLFFPAKIVSREDDFLLYPDFSNPSVNPAFFRSINAIAEDDITTAKDVLEILDGEPLTFSKVSKIQRLIESRYHDLETEELLLFPELENEKQIKKTKGLKVKSCAGICVLRKSSNSVHIIRELHELSNESSLSKPLEQLINKAPGTETTVESNFSVPTALNPSQIQVLKNAYAHSISVIIGPPGTGKSYTIAALVSDAIRQGQSILVTSAKNQAVDVVQQKIEQDLGLTNICIRAGGKGDYKALMKDKLDNLLNGIDLEYVDAKDVNKVEIKLDAIEGQIASLENQYLKLTEQSGLYGKWLKNSKNKLYHPITKFYVNSGLDKETTSWSIIQSLEKLYPNKYQLIKEFIIANGKARKFRSIRNNRSVYTRFAKAQKSRTIKTKNKRFLDIDFDELKYSFPVWLVNLSETANVLPLRKGLFDMVIIDEASQCDISTALPLLYRAKRTIICGDPKQLRHLSFLSEVKSQKLGKDFNLDQDEIEHFDFRNRSILDLTLDSITKQDAITFLNEHFRSHPEIIGYSNEKFYGGALSIMTEKPGLNEKDSVELVNCTGKRIDGVNKIEADLIVTRLKEQLLIEKKIKPALKSSIGILSPFREQVNYLSEKIREELNIDEIQNHNILIGTAHSFQGEERDTMYLSFCVNDTSHSTAIRHINKADVFNVSITRARKKQIVFYSISPKKLHHNHHLAQYIGFTTRKKELKPSEHDEFSKDVEDFLIENGAGQVFLNHNIMGSQFDLVVQKGVNLYGIDLIGYPGDYEATLPLSKVKVFKHNGHRFFPIPYHQWYLNGENLKQDLLKFLGLKADR